jgi:magnesium transporter
MPWLVTGHFRADQVQVLLRDDLMVTVSQVPVANVEAAWSRWSARFADAPAHVGDPAYLILDAIVDEYVPILDQLVEDMGDVERRILEENVASARAVDLRNLCTCKRDLAQFGRVVGPQRASIAALGRLIGDLVHEDSPAYFQDVSDHLARLGANVESYHDMLESSLNAYLVLVGNGQNEVMKTLTAVTIVMGIPTVITAWYGSNIQLPELAWPMAYSVTLAVMVALVAATTVVLRRRGLT